MVGEIRKKYLQVLKVRELSSAFGGSLFIFLLFTASVFFVWAFVQNGCYGLFDFPSQLSLAEQEDFAAFFRAGEMARHGEAASAYDPAIFIEPFSASNRNLLFLNPPHAFLLFEPLSYLGYPAAKALGLVLNVFCLVALVRMARLELGAWPYLFMFASCGVIYTFQLLQLSPIIVFLLVFAMLNSRARPLLSGVALALATVKPQYGLLMPVFLVANRDWRTFAVAAAGTLGLVAASIAVYGWSVWEAFFASMQGGAHSAQFLATHGMMTTIGQSLGKFGAGEGVRFWGQLSVLPFMAVVVWLAAIRMSRKRAVAVSLLAMGLAAPSFMFYDWLAYAAALLFVVSEVPRWSVALQLSAGLLWIAPILHDVIWRYDRAVAMFFSGIIPGIALIVLAMVFRLFATADAAEPESRETKKGRLQPAG